MAKITLSPITNGQNISNINNDFQEIEDALNDGVLWRDNPTGEPNQMLNSLDMNNNNLLNVNVLNAADVTVAGGSVTGVLQQAQAAATAASGSAAAAHVSEVNAAASAAAASTIISASLLKANNLSDVASPTAALSNIGGFPSAGGTISGVTTFSAPVTGTGGVINTSGVAVTGTPAIFRTAVNGNASTNVTTLFHYAATQNTFTGGAAVTNQYGFYASGSLSGAGNNMGFVGVVPIGTNNWNLYMSTTAKNYLQGNTLIGTTTDNGQALQVAGSVLFASGNNTMTQNETLGTGAINHIFQSAGVTQWGLQKSTAQNFNIQRYTSGTFVDNPISIANATGVVTFTASPIQPTPATADNSTTSATTGYVVAKLASPTPIGSSAPSSGAFTTLSANGAITPSQTAGIVGTTTNNNANAGAVGEYVTASATAIALTTGTVFNGTSISLTAGDWDVTGTIAYIGGAGANTSTMNVSVSTTSATQNTAIGSMSSIPHASPAATTTRICAPVVRLSLSATTTVYLVGIAAIAGGTATADALIRARRVR